MGRLDLPDPPRDEDFTDSEEEGAAWRYPELQNGWRNVLTSDDFGGSAQAPTSIHQVGRTRTFRRL